MGILRKLRTATLGSRDDEIRDPTGIYIYAKCDRCGAPVRARLDKAHDLERDFETGGFVAHKEMMDGTCFALLQAIIRFDAHYRVIDSHIDGGQLISWDEYQALRTPHGPSETP